MQRTQANRQADLTAARIAAIMDDADPSKMTDDELLEQYGQAKQDDAGDAQDAGKGQDDAGDAQDAGKGQDEDDDESEPVPEQPEPEQHDDDQTIEAIMRKIAREEDQFQNSEYHDKRFAHLLTKIERLQKRQITGNGNSKTTTVVIKRDNKPDVKVSGAHPVFSRVVKWVSKNEHVMLVGPAGSGKTTIAQQVATALGLEFYFTGAVAMEHKLTGFVDANGVFRDTQFFRAFTQGGLFLFDEVDGSTPNALLCFNAALANRVADFPEGKFEAHADFVCIAAANTFGRGADRQYVGRNKLDAASLDRFVTVSMDYDEVGELEWAYAESNGLGRAKSDAWVKTVQAIRKACGELKVHHVVSPRASIKGVRGLDAGLTRDEVLEDAVWKGLDEATVAKIIAHAKI
jgi:MoxR-like ATPase